MDGLVAEGAGFPAGDGIGLDKAAALSPYRFESGFGRGASYAPLAILLENNKTRDAPQFGCAEFGGVRAMVVAGVDARWLLPRAYWHQPTGWPLA